MTIETKKLVISEELKRKDGTMVNIIKDITFLSFNYSNEIFIENLSNKIKLSELED